MYSRKETNGYCSKCYRSLPDDMKTSPDSSPLMGPQHAEETSETLSSAPLEREEASSRPVQVKKSRCWACNKKVGLTGLECRCGYAFCSSHRYPDEHECDFDFKAHGKELLEKRNAKVGGSSGLSEKL